MILSDVSIREALESGRIIIDPLMDGAVQPSSVDLRVDRFFRVFRNDTTPFIDPKLAQEDLTELVEVADGNAFILHPGEFVLGSTLERVALPSDLVARLEGKSSLGRLGLLIHSSLPASETVYVVDDDGMRPMPIGDVVRKQLRAHVVGFDPETFAVGFHEITGWYEGPADRIYEIVLASGRRVRVTAGHNVFTLDRDGAVRKVRTGELRPGVRLAVPRRIPDPFVSPDLIEVAALVPETDADRTVVSGPTIAREFEERAGEVNAALRSVGIGHTDYYRSRAQLPFGVARMLPGLLASLDPRDRIAVRRSRSSLPAYISVDRELAWMLGLYVAEGSRRRNQFTISNTDQARLDRVEAVLARLGIPAHRGPGAVTGCSAIAALLLGWLGTGDGAPNKRVPPVVFGWPADLVEAFFDGLVDGDGRREDARTSVWTTSDALVGDLLVLCSRMGRRAGTSWKRTPTRPLCQVQLPVDEHKLLTGIPLPDLLTNGDLMWDRVVEVRDTGATETIYDIEVRPDGRHIENFLAGHGGVFVSNTAGFVDAGFDGHLTLELSNVANLPIAIYPGMKIGQISFLQMTTAAENPYGSQTTGSKYQGQRGPTPSRYYLNFKDE